MPVPVNPSSFLRRMTNKWEARGLAVSRPMQNSWEILCNTFNQHMENAERREWSVLPLATGVGKTQGVISYCAELAAHSTEQGVVIITRLTEEADKIVEAINAEAEREVAIAKHSKLPRTVSHEELNSSQIIVITHAAYKGAFELLDQRESGFLLHAYSHWTHGRRLVLIDEALSTEEPLEVDLEEVRLARQTIPIELEAEITRTSKDVIFLDKLIERFKAVGLERTDSSCRFMGAHGWSEGMEPEFNMHTGFPELLQHLEDAPVIIRKNAQHKTKISLDRKYCKEVLSKFSIVTARDSFYSYVNGRHTASYIKSILPNDLPSAVILDGTAKQNLFYDMLSDSVEVINVPSDVRNYSNVTLKVFYGISVGKGSLRNKDTSFFQELQRNHFPDLDPAETLFCVHKDVRDVFKEGTRVPDQNIAHWGAIDGRNDWRDLKNLVICGLPYLGERIADSTAMALNLWGTNAGYNYIEELPGFPEPGIMENEMPEDYWKVFEASHIAVRIIQAMNRVRCRKPINENGDCEPVEIVMFLKTSGDEEGSYEYKLLSYIRTAMPDINISIEAVTNPASQTRALNETEERFFNVLTSLGVGEHSAAQVNEQVAEAGVSQSSIKRYQSNLKNGKDDLLSQKLSGLGISYVCDGRGRWSNPRYIRW